MKMNIVDHAEAKAVSAKNGTKTRPKWPILLLLLVSVAIGAGGCTDYYAGSPAYGPGYAGGQYGRGYAANGPYAPGYAGSPGYAYPGSVTVEIGDRQYYTRGPGYYVGRTYYVWKPGHWASRNGQRVWIHGHYVVRGGY
jgi:WXXGXW repeat (2 copies)